MPKPVCLKCGRFYRMARSGIYWLEQMPRPGVAEPIPRGVDAEASWRPYKIWQGDKWRCHGCGHELIVGHGNMPVSEHYKEGFEKWMLDVVAKVNDC